MNKEQRLSRDLDRLREPGLAWAQVYIKEDATDAAVTLADKHGWAWRVLIGNKSGRVAGRTDYLSTCGPPDACLVAWDQALEVGLVPYVSTVQVRLFVWDRDSPWTYAG